MIGFIKEKAIGRWSEYRANRFLDAFVEEVRKEKDVKMDSAELNDRLRLVASSDHQTSALFDAYRRVALSASKDVGPMVIGLLTARIVLDDREASEVEEMVFQGAEALNDRDFADLRQWMQHLHGDAQYSADLAARDKRGTHEAIRVYAKGAGAAAWLGALARSTYPGSPDQAATDVDSPLSLYRDVGPFALKLRSVGLIEEERDTSGRTWNGGGIKYFIHISAACEVLTELSTRANGAVEKHPLGG
ncbi:hypothetical protein [Caballeronia sp. GAFFF3]|uniref:hypothetical protein n=1 Tax=Caballeronia sp. GAFFF3 TaxID=2921759 RepID=UPI0020284052|nr:hypothetical protein [Caballeronia sp. GAFFF3]